VLARDAGYDHVGGRAGQGAVPAQARAQGQCPPQDRAVMRMLGNDAVEKRYHGRDERHGTDKCRGECRDPEYCQRHEGQISVGDLGEFVCQDREHALLVDCRDHDEKTDKEEYGGPFDLFEDLFDRGPGEEHDERRAGQGDGGGLQMQKIMHDKPDNGEQEYHQADAGEPQIGDGLSLVEFHDGRDQFGLDFER